MKNYHKWFFCSLNGMQFMIYFVTSVRLLEFTNFCIDLNNIWSRHLKIPLMKELCWTGITHWDWDVWKLKSSLIGLLLILSILHNSVLMSKLRNPMDDGAELQWAASQHLRSSTSQSGGEENWGNYFQEAGIVQDTRNNQSIYTSTPKTCVIMIFSGDGEKDKRSILTQSH